MRKWNAVLTALILILFLLHAVVGSLQMAGLSAALLPKLARTMTALVCVHALIGVKLTVDSLKVWKRTGVSYWKENRLFWARRISGFAVMLFLVAHVTAFGHTVEGAYRLRYFDALRLAAQLLLALSLALHILSNVRPMLISFGVKRLKERSADLLLVLSLLLLLMGAAFVVYFLRWRAL